MTYRRFVPPNPQASVITICWTTSDMSSNLVIALVALQFNLSLSIVSCWICCCCWCKPNLPSSDAFHTCRTLPVPSASSKVDECTQSSAGTTISARRFRLSIHASLEHLIVLLLRVIYDSSVASFVMTHSWSTCMYIFYSKVLIVNPLLFVTNVSSLCVAE